MKTKYIKFILGIYYKFFLFVGIFFIAYLVGCEKEDFLKKPEVKTIEVDNPATSSILVTGEILNPDDSKIETYGFCWSESENPEISDNIIKLGIDTLKGIYSSLIDGLKPGFKYYIRAYAENEAGIGYGESIAFETEDGIIEISTNEILNITDSSAIAGGNILDYGGSEILERGICWNKDGQPTIDDSTSISYEVTNLYSCNLHDLNYGTIYYVKAYTKNEIGIYYGDEISFRTDTLPIVISSVIENISINSATVGGNVTSDGGASVTERGVYYGTSSNPETTGSKLVIGSGTGAFTKDLTGLLSSTTYYVKAYAINSAGTSYGAEESFTTSQEVVAPTVSTNSITDITDSSATAGGEVTSDGGASITERGVYYGTSSNSETTGTKLVIGSGTGAFTKDLTGLSSSTTYYVKAYAINSSGTSYGAEESFTTSQEILAPTVSTNSITDITDSSATVGGNVTSDGGASVTERGVYYGTSSNPETTGTKLVIGSGTGTFTTGLTGLSSSTTYYVKAYAINSVGTSYGNEIIFTTESTIVAPTLTTTAISGISSTGASSGGTISSDGGASVTARGVCWSTSTNPTTTDSKTSDGTGTGSFTSTLSGLNPNTTYYVRAYATNSAGTSYGNEESFTTNSTTVAPTVTTSSATDILETSATVGGEVTSDGGASVTERGIYYGTSSNPETTGTKLQIGTGVFSTSLSSLTSNTTYYIKAYAINSVGTSYGNELNFTTDQSIVSPTVITSSATDITDISATVGGEVTFEGGATVTERGIYYGTSSNPETTGTKLQIGNGVGVFSTSLAGLTASTTYYIKAYAINIVGVSYGDEQIFNTYTDMSGVPSLYTPSNGSTQYLGISIYFSWSSVSVATYYELQFDPGTGWEYTETVYGTSISWSGGEGTHTWRVRARNGSYAGAWSSIRTYTVVGVPSIPSLSSPSNGANVNISTSQTFSWSSVSNATSYQIQFDSDSPINVSGTSKSKSFTSVGSHTWKVRAYNPAGYSSWSSSRSFTVF